MVHRPVTHTSVEQCFRNKVRGVTQFDTASGHVVDDIYTHHPGKHRLANEAIPKAHRTWFVHMGQRKDHE